MFEHIKRQLMGVAHEARHAGVDQASQLIGGTWANIGLIHNFSDEPARSLTGARYQLMGYLHLLRPDSPPVPWLEKAIKLVDPKRLSETAPPFLPKIWTTAPVTPPEPKTVITETVVPNEEPEPVVKPKPMVEMPDPALYFDLPTVPAKTEKKPKASVKKPKASVKKSTPAKKLKGKKK